MIVTTDGLIKVSDFGLAKLVEKERNVSGVSELTTMQVPSNRNETLPGVIMGTVSYMSPEQARAEKLDNRTDIFSLGVVLYEIVSGERPFQGKSVIDTLHAIINQEPPPLVKLNSQLPPELADILGKALTKEPAERYQHAGDFELDLRRLKKAIESNSLISSQSRALNVEVGKRKTFGPWSVIAGASGYCRDRSYCLDARPFDEAGKSDGA